MLFFLVLAASYAAIWPVTRGRITTSSRARLALAAGMTVAGIAHVVTPTPFIQHLPDVIPMRDAIVLASGLVEIAFGAALVGPARWRPVAGLLLAAYLVAVFPGNVYVAVAGIDVEGQPGGLYAWLRLPLQAIFVWVAVWSTGALGAIRPLLVPDRLKTFGGLGA